jgi:hypothetical protein
VSLHPADALERFKERLEQVTNRLEKLRSDGLGPAHSAFRSATTFLNART